ncbi:MAG: prepilin peptidase [Desulfurobacteriaceae bacterium]
MECFFAFILGLIVGSFLNVCIYRIPKGKSVVLPPSSCPNCGSPIAWYDNIPVISYLILKGKCRHCGEKISIRYPLVEILTALMTLAVTCKFGVSFDLFYYLILVYYLIVISFIDIDTMEIPVKFSYFALILGIILSPLSRNVGLIDSVLGASFGAGIILFIIETYYILTGKEGMGYGDANIMAVIGAFLGWKLVPVALFFASLIGTAVGITLMVLKKKDRRLALPFGPFLAAGALTALFYGREILNWYLEGIGTC